MSDYSPVQLINHARYALTRARNDLKTAMLALNQGRSTYQDCMDCEQMLCEVQRQLDRAVQRQRLDARREWKLRHAEEFALKSQLAKARQAVAEVLIEREDEPSHK